MKIRCSLLSLRRLSVLTAHSEGNDVLSGKCFLQSIGQLHLAEDTIGKKSVDTTQGVDGATEMASVVHQWVR